MGKSLVYLNSRAGSVIANGGVNAPGFALVGFLPVYDPLLDITVSPRPTDTSYNTNIYPAGMEAYERMYYARVRGISLGDAATRYAAEYDDARPTGEIIFAGTETPYRVSDPSAEAYAIGAVSGPNVISRQYKLASVNTQDGKPIGYTGEAIPVKVSGSLDFSAKYGRKIITDPTADSNGTPTGESFSGLGYTTEMYTHPFSGPEVAVGYTNGLDPNAIIGPDARVSDADRKYIFKDVKYREVQVDINGEMVSAGNFTITLSEEIGSVIFNKVALFAVEYDDIGDEVPGSLQYVGCAYMRNTMMYGLGDAQYNNIQIELVVNFATNIGTEIAGIVDFPRYYGHQSTAWFSYNKGSLNANYPVMFGNANDPRALGMVHARRRLSDKLPLTIFDADVMTPDPDAPGGTSLNTIRYGADINTLGELEFKLHTQPKNYLDFTPSLRTPTILPGIRASLGAVGDEWLNIYGRVISTSRLDALGDTFINVGNSLMAAGSTVNIGGKETPESTTVNRWGEGWFTNLDSTYLTMQYLRGSLWGFDAVDQGLPVVRSGDSISLAGGAKKTGMLGLEANLIPTEDGSVDIGLDEDFMINMEDGVEFSRYAKIKPTLDVIYGKDPRVRPISFKIRNVVAYRSIVDHIGHDDLLFSAHSAINFSDLRKTETPYAKWVKTAAIKFIAAKSVGMLAGQSGYDGDDLILDFVVSDDVKFNRISAIKDGIAFFDKKLNLRSLGGEDDWAVLGAPAAALSGVYTKDIIAANPTAKADFIGITGGLCPTETAKYQDHITIDLLGDKPTIGFLGLYGAARAKATADDVITLGRHDNPWGTTFTKKIIGDTKLKQSFWTVNLADGYVVKSERDAYWDAPIKTSTLIPFLETDGTPTVGTPDQAFAATHARNTATSRISALPGCRTDRYTVGYNGGDGKDGLGQFTPMQPSDRVFHGLYTELNASLIPGFGMDTRLILNDTGVASDTGITYGQWKANRVLAQLGAPMQAMNAVFTRFIGADRIYRSKDLSGNPAYDAATDMSANLYVGSHLVPVTPSAVQEHGDEARDITDNLKDPSAALSVRSFTPTLGRMDAMWSEAFIKKFSSTTGVINFAASLIPVGETINLGSENAYYNTLYVKKIVGLEEKMEMDSTIYGMDIHIPNSMVADIHDIRPIQFPSPGAMIQYGIAISPGKFVVTNAAGDSKWVYFNSGANTDLACPIWKLVTEAPVTDRNRAYYLGMVDLFYIETTSGKHGFLFTTRDILNHMDAPSRPNTNGVFAWKVLTFIPEVHDAHNATILASYYISDQGEDITYARRIATLPMGDFVPGSQPSNGYVRLIEGNHQNGTFTPAGDSRLFINVLEGYEYTYSDLDPYDSIMVNSDHVKWNDVKPKYQPHNMAAYADISTEFTGLYDKLLLTDHGCAIYTDAFGNNKIATSNSDAPILVDGNCSFDIMRNRHHLGSFPLTITVQTRLKSFTRPTTDMFYAI